MFCGAELSDLLTTSAYIPRAAYVQKHRKCELRACLIGRVPRHSSPAGMQNPKFSLCIIQISQLLLLCVGLHCVIQNAHFELKFKIRTLLSCENSQRFKCPVNGLSLLTSQPQYTLRIMIAFLCFSSPVQWHYESQNDR